MSPPCLLGKVSNSHWNMSLEVKVRAILTSNKCFIGQICEQEEYEQIFANKIFLKQKRKSINWLTRLESTWSSEGDFAFAFSFYLLNLIFSFFIKSCIIVCK